MIKSSLIFIALLLSTFSFCQITYDTTVFEGQGGFYGMPFSTDFDITDKGSVYYMSSSPNVLSIYNEVDSSPGLSIIKYIKPKFDSIVGFEDAFTMDVSDDEKYLFFGGIGVVHAYKINSNSN